MHSSRQSEISSHSRPANGAAATLRNIAAVAVLVALPLMAAPAAAQYGGPHNQLRYDEVQGSPQTQYQPQYNDSAARQTPRIAQPQTLTPLRTYAPAPPDPTTGAAIIQPDYLTPAKEPPTVAKEAPKPPVTAPVPPGPNNSVAAKPPAVKKPVERSAFWQLVLGPSDTDSTKNQTAPAAPQRTHYSTPAPQAQAAAGSLWSQFLGHNAAPQQLHAQPQPQRQPQPRVTSAPPAPATKANPLQLAAAEESNTWWPYPPPTVKDIQDAKTPAVSATITVSGGLPPANAQSTTAAAQPAPTGAPNSQGIPTVPSVPGMTHSEMSSAAYGLFQPFQMTSDAPVAAMPVGENVLKTAESNRKQKSEMDSVPSLLQPFYATNGSPSSSRRSRGSSNTTAKAPESISEALIASPLGRQLSMQSDEDLRTSGLASIEADVSSEKPWDGTVTVTWPLMANPFVMPENVDSPVAVPSNVAQVAFMQDSLPSSGGSSNSNDDDKSADSEKKDDKGTLVGSETLGNAPEDNTLAFLRTQTVLLAPGKHQFDIGIEYTITENDFPILREADGGGVFVDNVEFKARELAVPMELRYGLLPRLQGFLQVPVGWSNVQAAFDNYDEYENDGGLGDIGFGLTAQLRDAFKDCPYIIGTLAGLAPTGGDPFGVVGQITPNAPSLGNGFWAISGNLLWVQTRYDPVVVYYGLGARYQFEHEYFGVEFQPGMEYNYTLGAGFAVNERCTLSTQFFGAFIEELKANGERVEGTIQEPLNLRVAATLAKPCNRLVEPFCTFGLTDDAISSNVGITWTY